MSLDSVYITWIILTGLAVVLDVGLMRWLRRNWQADESSPHVRWLGSYSPILTWLKYRRLPTWKRRRPSVAAASFAPSVSRIETPAASALNPELNHRIALIVLLLSAVGLTALGQMDNQLTTILLLGAALLNLAWLWRHSSQPEAAPPLPASPLAEQPLTWQGIRAGTLKWLRRHSLEVVVVLLAIVIGLYVWQISPATSLTGLTQPGKAGNPFNGFHFVRDFQLRYTQQWAMVLAVGGSVLSAGLLAWAWLGRRIGQSPTRYAQAGLLVAALGLAGLGQLALLGYYPGSGLNLYILAAALFAVWAVTYRSHVETDLLASPWPRWLEGALLIMVLGLTSFARFYKLRTIPYGAEGDEMKWTVEVVSAMMDSRYFEATEYHLSSLPLSFYLQAPFHRALGPGLLSARVAVATYSVLASLVFYWLVRQLTGAPVAWLATMLLAISPFDISASRLANVESHVKLWPVLALALLIQAARRGRLVFYVLAGVAVALAMLTYDTLAPLIGVSLLILLDDLIRARVPFAEAVRRVTAFLAPVLVVALITAAYLTGRLQYYALGSRQWDTAPLARFGAHLGDLMGSLFVLTHGDFLYNRQGPLFNSLELPWLAFGTVLALVHWKRDRLLWWLLFAGLFFFPTPILVNSPMGRVLYPALPAAYLIMALGMVAAWHDLGRALGAAFKPALSVLAVIGLGYLAMLNLYIYFNEVQDAEDRQQRRELYEIAREAVEPGSMIYFAYVPSADDPIQQEEHWAIWLGVRSRGTAASQQPPYTVIPLESLLSALSANTAEYDHAEVVWDTFSTALRSQREGVLSALQRCYPGVERLRGRFFDRYVIPGTALRNPLCGSGTLTLAAETTTTRVGMPIHLTWTLQGTAAPSLSLECSTARMDTLIVEAATLQGPAWERTTEYVTDFEGEGFLFDDLGSQAAALDITLPQGQSFYVWVRSLRRAVDDYPGYAGIGERGEPFSMASAVPLNQWVWQRVGPFDTTGPSTRLTLTRPYPGSATSFMGLFVDTLIVISSAAFDPNVNSAWEETFQQSLPVPEGESSGTFDFSNRPGIYRCWVRATDGEKLVDALGNAGLRSNPVEIRIQPAP